MAGESASTPRILVVRRDNIGDLVCTTPLLHALRARFPRGRIAAFVNTYNGEVLARNPSLDAAYAYEKLKHRRSGVVSNLVQRLRLGSRLRGERFDWILVPAATPRAVRLAASLSPCEIIIGRQDMGGHEVQRTFALGETLGITGEPGPMRVYPHLRVREHLEKRLGTGPFVAVHISARRPAQRWSAACYVELIKRLKKKVILLWAPGGRTDPRHPGDDEAARQITTQAEPVAVPTPNLETLIAALSLAECVICPDGGAMHLAAALGKPVVALFGDSPVERWRPWGVPHRVVRPDSGDLSDLLPRVVVSAYEELCRS